MLSKLLSDALVGRRVVKVRSLLPVELEQLYWNHCSPEDTVVLVFDDGSAVISMCDPEGNGPGFLELCSVGS